MVLSLDLVSLILYCIQQVGIMLGVGAQTILLITYTIAVRDGVVDAKESQIARAVTKALVAGLGLMVFSGIAIAAMHFLAGQWAVLMAPAFLFKWMLMAFLIIVTFLWHNKPYPDFVWQGIMGATWYGMFILHIIAPVAAWFDLVVLYIVWTAGFLLLWSAGVFTAHKKEKGSTATPVKIPEKMFSDLLEDSARPSSQKLLPVPPLAQKTKVEEKKPKPEPEPKPIIKVEPPKPVVAQPILPIIKPEPVKIVLPQIITTVLPPQPPVASKPDAPKVEDKKVVVQEHPGLPAIRVMPRTKEELAKHI